VDDEAAHLLARLREGDQDAASELFRRYAERLVALARSRLSAKLTPRLDPEDVVQSAYRSFFAGARDGRYDLERWGDLWRLLVTITLNKLHHQHKRNTADRRSVDRELNSDAVERTGGIPPGLLTREPSPVEAIALAEELEQLMRRLEPLHRRMLELALQGYGVEEIAADTQRSERTVRRVLERVKQELE
jgi:RNA polymerase sigma-70 factor (ECF subfamily)